MAKELIKKGDVVALVLAQMDCDTPLFIGVAAYDADGDRNEAEFAGTFFMDDEGWKAKKVPYKTFARSYHFGYNRSTDLGDRAESRGYVWVWTVIPSRTFRDSAIPK